MLCNREFQWMMTVIVSVSFAGICAGFLIAPAAGWLALALSSVLAAAFFFFTRRRYRALHGLSEALQAVCAGDYSIDLRDMSEGELSILKSDIYKVTVMLREQAVRLDGEKRKLADALSDISHQMKTPLTSMMMMTELLEDAQLPAEKRREFTQNIARQLDRMEWLVTTLLKLSKIDAGSVAFHKKKIPVETLLQRAAAPLLIPMELREQTLSIGECGGEEWLCDPEWTAEAILNLLKNCMEHTPAGGVVEIHCESTALYSQICISDTGEGIAQAELPYIFNRFYRGANAGRESVGIGLAMAHSILTGQGGDITVKSRLGKGTSFFLKLPKQVV